MADRNSGKKPPVESEHRRVKAESCGRASPRVEATNYRGKSCGFSLAIIGAGIELNCTLSNIDRGNICRDQKVTSTSLPCGQCRSGDYAIRVLPFCWLDKVPSLLFLQLKKRQISDLLTLASQTVRCNATKQQSHTQQDSCRHQGWKKTELFNSRQTERHLVCMKRGPDNCP